MHWSSKKSNDWLSSSVVGQFFSVLLVEFLSLGTIYAFLRWKKTSFKKIGLVKIKLKDVYCLLLAVLATLYICRGAWRHPIIPPCVQQSKLHPGARYHANKQQHGCPRGIHPSQRNTEKARGATQSVSATAYA